jgi:ubiquinone/menaquinone biosynthesis C-methylase UbiE
MLRRYLRSLYQRTMHKAYGKATDEIVRALQSGGQVLDCGAGSGWMYPLLSEQVALSPSDYFGIDWDEASVNAGQRRGLNIVRADLNDGIPFEPNRFNCVYAVSVLEHLLNGCRFLRECHRVLHPGGTLVLLTPNISTYFTAALILMGKMPSSGPHPDSKALLKGEEVVKVSSDELQPDVERATPVHRHLVVFSYRVLRRYLSMIGLEEIRGYGFGLYPAPNVLQPLLERIDPWHCHQMVFVASKPVSGVLSTSAGPRI